MSIDIDLTSHAPIYTQLIDQVKHAIASGALKPGDQLPTVRQLAADLRVNFNTIARAYRILDEEGIISTQHGRGTFILEPSSQRKSEALRREGLDVLIDHFLQEVEKLEFGPDEALELIKERINERN